MSPHLRTPSSTRRREYTQTGLHGLRCSYPGCFIRAFRQWFTADGIVRPVCVHHDMDLHRSLLEQLGTPDIENVMAKYEAQLRHEWSTSCGFKWPMSARLQMAIDDAWGERVLRWKAAVAEAKAGPWPYPDWVGISGTRYVHYDTTENKARDDMTRLAIGLLVWLGCTGQTWKALNRAAPAGQLRPATEAEVEALRQGAMKSGKELVVEIAEDHRRQYDKAML